jgi:hypothetical protein
MRVSVRIAATLIAALLSFCAAADTVTLKNGEKIEGHVQKYDKGTLVVQVPAGYVSGFPTTSGHKVRMSNVRTIAFDGNDDYFSIVLKNGDTADGAFGSFSKGEFEIPGSKPVKFSSIKAFSQSSRPADKNASAKLSLLDLALGQTGEFKHTLLVGFIFEKGFIGQLNFRSPASGRYEQKIVVIRGVDTSGLTSGSWARLNQEFRVSRTERLTSGDTVLVAEPADPSKTNVSPGEPMGGADSDWSRVQPENP